MFDFLASERQYLEHLLPIYQELQDVDKGDFHINTPDLCAHAHKQGVKKIRYFEIGKLSAAIDPNPNVPAVVSSIADAQMVKSASPHKPVILCEHGCGQTYDINNSAYAGGPNRDFISMFLVPGRIPYAKQKLNYPNIPCYIIGCPKMDRYKDYVKPEKVLTSDNVVIGVSFHWDSKACNETSSAFNYFWNNVKKAVDAMPNAKFLGHCHPRLTSQIRLPWEQLRTTYPNVKFVGDFHSILDAADLYICDNSSTIYEFVSLDKGVILLNSPRYSRSANHGMRFWDKADVGVNCEHTDDLHEKILEAIEAENNHTFYERRALYTEEIYTVPHGSAAKEAVSRLLAFIPAPQKPKIVVESTVPTLKAKALRFSITDEGQLYHGLDFFPGWFHEIGRDAAGNIICNPTKKITWTTPEIRMHQLLSEKMVVRVEQLQPVNSSPIVLSNSSQVKETPRVRRKRNVDPNSNPG
jgi:hypothetical protein